MASDEWKIPPWQLITDCTQFWWEQWLERQVAKGQARKIIEDRNG